MFPYVFVLYFWITTSFIFSLSPSFILTIHFHSYMPHVWKQVHMKPWNFAFWAFIQLSAKAMEKTDDKAGAGLV